MTQHRAETLTSLHTTSLLACYILHMRIFLFSLLLALLLSPSLRAEQPLHFGTFPDTQSPTLAICEQIIREAYAALGHSIEIEHLPGNRSIYWAQSGKLDGELCRTQPFAGLIKVEPALFNISIHAFSVRELPIHGWEDLKGLKINYERSMKSLQEKTEHLDATPANGIHNALEQLQKGRTDVYLNEPNSVLFVASQLGMHNLIIHQPALDTAPLYHQLNSKHVALAKQLSIELQRMSKSGRLAEIEQQTLHDAMESYSPAEQ